MTNRTGSRGSAAAPLRPFRLGVDLSGLRTGQAGVGRYLLNMLRGFDAHRPDLDLRLYSACPIALPEFLRHRVLRVGSGPASRSSSLWVQRCLPGLLAEDRVDVFWGQNQLVPISLRHECRRVVTLHDLTAFVVPETMPVMSRLTHRLLLRRVLEAADLVIAVSQATQKLARRFFDVADKTVLIGEGVGRDIVVQSGQETRSRVARLLGEVGDFLLTVGTIEPRKNHRLLLDALERMDSPPLLVVVGRQGWRSARLRARMRTFEAAGRLRALGFVSDEDLAALYREAVLVVCPSVYEGFGLPVLEAMAHGCPVVCSWSSSLPEIGLAAARYFDPKDAAQLARVLAELLADRDARQTMARLGVTRAAEFSFSTASAALLAAIDRLGGPDRFGHGGRARYGPAGGQSRLTAA